jgi:hypothetical protein
MRRSSVGLTLVLASWAAERASLKDLPGSIADNSNQRRSMGLVTRATTNSVLS